MAIQTNKATIYSLVDATASLQAKVTANGVSVTGKGVALQLAYADAAALWAMLKAARGVAESEGWI